MLGGDNIRRSIQINQDNCCLIMIFDNIFRGGKFYFFLLLVQQDTETPILNGTYNQSRKQKNKKRKKKRNKFTINKLL